MDAFHAMTVAFGLEALALAGSSLANFSNLKRAQEAEKEVVELKKQLKEAEARLNRRR